MLHPGTLFALLFVALAPTVAGLLLWRSVRRGLREVESRGRIVLAAATALVVWAAATDYMLTATFATAWGVAHMRPIPEGMFPEGWVIYAFLAAYAGLGLALLIGLSRIPPQRRAS